MLTKRYADYVITVRLMTRMKKYYNKEKQLNKICLLGFLNRNDGKNANSSRNITQLYRYASLLTHKCATLLISLLKSLLY